MIATSDPVRFSSAKTTRLMGGEITILVPTEATGGRWSMMLYVAPAGLPGPIAHLHREMEETFTILEGEMTFKIGGETRILGPGESVVVPPNVVHEFRNHGTETCRMIGHFSPGGLEKYFEELAELVATSETWPPQDLSALGALMTKYDSYPVR